MHGSGVFVAPNVLVTCAHVVGNRREGDEVIVRNWADVLDSTSRTGRVLYINRRYDLALVSVEGATGVSAAIGENVRLDDHLVGLGFPERDGRNEFDQFTALSEGLIDSLADDGLAIKLGKFKAGQVEPGYSGGPVLNPRTGRVVGIILATRDRSSALGGWFVPASAVEDALESLGERATVQAGWEAAHKQQNRFHSLDRRDANELVESTAQKPGSPTVDRTVLRIFLSTGDDVADEAEVATRVMRIELASDPILAGRIDLEVWTWRQVFANAVDVSTVIAESSFVGLPWQCDAVVAVVWNEVPSEPDLERTFGVPSSSNALLVTEDTASQSPTVPTMLFQRVPPRLISPAEEQRAMVLERYDALREFLMRIAKRDDPTLILEQYFTTVEFRDRLARSLRQVISKRLALDGSSRRNEHRRSWSKDPYVGLRPYSESEADIYTGRQTEIDALTSRLSLDDCRFVAITGGSGTGKSSLLRAGLLPRLTKGGLAGSRGWEELYFTPTTAADDPFLPVAAYVRSQSPLLQARTAAELARDLQRDVSKLGVWLRQDLLKSHSGLIICVDQFEEMFTAIDVDRRAAFVRLLGSATALDGVKVVLAIRSDFIGECETVSDLIALLQRDRATFPLGKIGGLALAEIVGKPSGMVGVEVASDVTDAFIEDIGHDAGMLPFVSSTLRELHIGRRAGTRICLDDYVASGGLRGSIRRMTDAAMDRVRSDLPNLSAALELLFSRLVVISANGTATRARATQADITASAEVLELARRLIGERLLTADEFDGRSSVYLAHEALIGQWVELKEWVSRNQEYRQRLALQYLAIESPHREDRLHAAITLGTIEPVEAATVTALISRLLDTSADVREAASAAIKRLGAPTLPHLRIRFRSEDDAEMRAALIRVLSTFGQEVINDLVTSADDPEPMVEEAAMRGLVLYVDDPRAQLVLARGLVRPDRPYISLILDDLSQGTKNAAFLLSTLERIFSQSEAVPELQISVLAVLARIDSEEAARSMLPALRTASTDVRQAARVRLKGLNPGTLSRLENQIVGFLRAEVTGDAQRDAIEVLVALPKLEPRSFQELVRAVVKLNRLPGKEPISVPFEHSSNAGGLALTLVDVDNDVRDLAKSILEHLPTIPEALTESLSELIEKVSLPMALTVIEIFAAKGLRIPVAAHGLMMAALESHEYSIRQQAERLLIAHGRRLAGSAKLALSSKLRRVRDIALNTIARDRLGDVDMLADLRVIISEPELNKDALLATLRVLSQLGRGASPLAETVIQLLLSSDSEIQTAAIDLIASIGSAAVGAAERLEELHAVGDSWRKAQVVRALQSVLVDAQGAAGASGERLRQNPAAHANTMESIVSETGFRDLGVLLARLSYADEGNDEEIIGNIARVGHSSDPDRLKFSGELVGYLEHHTPRVRITACWALGTFLDVNDDIARSMVSLLNDPHRDVREAAAAALGTLNRVPGDVVDALRVARKQGLFRMEGDAVRAQRHIGSA